MLTYYANIVKNDNTMYPTFLFYFWILLLISLGVKTSVANDHSFENWKQSWSKTDFSKYSIPFNEIMSTGLPKGAIPAIDRPRFVSIRNARKWVRDNEPVIVVVVKNEARAYPLQIMVFHQIVNDKIKGEPLLISFCPLCNNSTVYERKVDSKVLSFNTTGLLRNSGLIMYDKQTETWWQQFTGDGLVGHYANKQLKNKYPTYIISFKKFKAHYPKGKVLSRDTGYQRQYGLNPFTGYDAIDNSPLPLKGNTDPRLPPMERVLNVNINGNYKLYTYQTISKNPVINDSFNDTAIVVFSKSGYASPLDKQEIIQSKTVPVAAAFNRYLNNMTLTFTFKDQHFVDDQTGSQWNIFGHAIHGKLKGAQLQRVDIGSHFAFASLAFRPNAKIYNSTFPSQKNNREN